MTETQVTTHEPKRRGRPPGSTSTTTSNASERAVASMAKLGKGVNKALANFGHWPELSEALTLTATAAQAAYDSARNLPNDYRAPRRNGARAGVAVISVQDGSRYQIIAHHTARYLGILEVDMGRTVEVLRAIDKERVVVELIENDAGSGIRFPCLIKHLENLPS